MHKLSTLFAVAVLSVLPLQSAMAGIIFIEVTEYDAADIQLRGDLDGNVAGSDAIDLRYSHQLTAAQVSAIQTSEGGELTLSFIASAEVAATGNGASSASTVTRVIIVNNNGDRHNVSTVHWSRGHTSTPASVELPQTIDLTSTIDDLEAGYQIQLWVDGSSVGSTGGTTANDKVDLTYGIEQDDGPVLEF